MKEFSIDDRIAEAKKIGRCSKCGKKFDGTVPEALSLSSSKMCSDCEFKECEAEFQKGFKE